MASGMQAAAEALSWGFAFTGMGPFTEFCDILSRYAQICHRAAERGIDFTAQSIHHKVPLPVHNQDVEYIADKLGGLLGPMLRANPEAKERLRRMLFCSKEN